MDGRLPHDFLLEHYAMTYGLPYGVYPDPALDLEEYEDQVFDENGEDAGYDRARRPRRRRRRPGGFARGRHGLSPEKRAMLRRRMLARRRGAAPIRQGMLPPRRRRMSYDEDEYDGLGFIPMLEPLGARIKDFGLGASVVGALAARHVIKRMKVPHKGLQRAAILVADITALYAGYMILADAGSEATAGLGDFGAARRRTSGRARTAARTITTAPTPSTVFEAAQAITESGSAPSTSFMASQPQTLQTFDPSRVGVRGGPRAAGAAGGETPSYMRDGGRAGGRGRAAGRGAVPCPTVLRQIRRAVRRDAPARQRVMSVRRILRRSGYGAIDFPGYGVALPAAAASLVAAPAAAFVAAPAAATSIVAAPAVAGAAAASAFSIKALERRLARAKRMKKNARTRAGRRLWAARVRQLERRIKKLSRRVAARGQRRAARGKAMTARQRRAVQALKRRSVRVKRPKRPARPAQPSRFPAAPAATMPDYAPLPEASYEADAALPLDVEQAAAQAPVPFDAGASFAPAAAPSMMESEVAGIPLPVLLIGGTALIGGALLLRRGKGKK